MNTQKRTESSTTLKQHQRWLVSISWHHSEKRTASLWGQVRPREATSISRAMGFNRVEVGKVDIILEEVRSSPAFGRSIWNTDVWRTWFHRHRSMLCECRYVPPMMISGDDTWIETFMSVLYQGQLLKVAIMDGWPRGCSTTMWSRLLTTQDSWS